MRVVVTGGTGLLGRSLVPALIDAGHQVVALVRSCERARALAACGAELLEGDLTEPTSYRERLAGADALIHAAACYGEYYRQSRSDAQLLDVNVRGTARLLEACLDNGIRRVVYVSSAGVLETASGTPTDESAAYASADDGPYFASKIEAERAARAFADEHPELQLVLLLPTVMIGPRDAGPTPTGAVLERVLGGEVKIIFPGAMNVVDARDVAAAAVAALTRGEPGTRYLLGGQRHSIREIFETLTRSAGRPAPTKAPPAAMLKLMLRLRGAVARLKGKRPPLRATDIDRLQRDFSFDSTAAARDLGVRFRPLEQTLADTAAWFLSERAEQPSISPT
jgi:dihydroflavonol-4-reductase